MSESENLYARFREQFQMENRALVCEGDVFTYNDVDKITGTVASTLTDFGLTKGDLVSVIGGKSLNFLWLYLGCLRVGCIFHPLNPAYTPSEIQFFLRDAKPKLIVSSHDLRSKFDGVDRKKNTEILPLDGRDGDRLFRPRSEHYRSFETVKVRGDDTAALLYSSGTTGDPKGIRLTHGNLFSNASTLKDLWEFDSSDTVLHVLPVFHVHGLFILLGPSLLSGCQIKYALAFDVKEVIAELADSTVMAGVPTYYSRLLADPTFSANCCRSVRVFISGSAPLSEKLFARFKARTGKSVLERYGMTETGVNTSNPINGNRIAGSVGQVLPGVKLRISSINKADGGANRIGSIEVKGENVFPEYWNLPEKTSEAFTKDGWFITGDQGYLDDDEYLYISGRSKDMIISGGLNVYPKEVEKEIEQDDLVLEVAVFGVEHSDFGEAVVAAVVTTNEKELCRETLLDTLSDKLAKYKLPKAIVTLDELPRNAMGKIQKTELRKKYKDLFL